MRNFLHAIIMAALTAVPAYAFAGDDNPVSGTTRITPTAVTQGAPTKSAEAGWVHGNMPCDKNNTVYDQGIDLTVAGNKGFVKSDMSYVPYRDKWFHAKSYCQFSNNVFPVDGVRVYGVFINSTYTFEYKEATERLHLDDEGNMTKPLRLCVEFCKDSYGFPGTVVYKEEMDVYGTKSQGTAGDETKGDESVPVYCFDIKLSEKVTMENGWICVYACDTGEHQNTAFAMISDSTPKGAGISIFKYEDQDDDIISAAGSYNFCLTGDKTASFADKGIKFMRVLSPDTDEHGKYAKVQVELWNYGRTAVSDATLTLYDGDTELATEKVDATIQPNSYYKYTFRKRIDCSAEGEHTFKVKNVTPNDGHYTADNISFTTKAAASGTLCESRSDYNAKYKYITSVKCGSIDNSSEWSLYSDFRSQSTDLTPGETVTLNVGKRAATGDYIKVWVDWNGDGAFDGDGEFIGYASNQSLDITVPTTIAVKPGARVMRIILSDDINRGPCEVYKYGETEDYTINVLRPAGSAALTLDTDEMTFDSSINDNPSKAISVKNGGDGQLDVTYDVVYSLPLLPNTNNTYSAPKLERPSKLNVAPANTSAARSSLATNDAPFVLTYAGEYNATAGAQYPSIKFAQYFPATALEAISGMKISSLDVYIIEPAAGTSKVCIWKGAKDMQGYTDGTLYSKEFKPVANSWNHIQFDEPFVISGNEDLYAGVLLEGCSDLQYEIGVDRGPASLGFGDLMAYGDYDQWWSLADLGVDANLMIRANVTGARTPAVDWLHLDKAQDTLAPATEGTLTVTANPWRIDQTVYDAAIRVVSNDPMSKTVKIPVYLDNADGTVNNIRFINADAAKSNLRITADRHITIDTDRHVAYIALFTSDGRQLAMNFDTNTIDASTLQHGIYVVKAVLDDNTTVSGTVAVK